MAPRAHWKGYLKLSLVSCPIALYPAISAAERVSFRQVNRQTGNRLRQQLVDSVTGEVVQSHDKGRGYELGERQLLLVEDEELEQRSRRRGARPYSAAPAASPAAVHEPQEVPEAPRTDTRCGSRARSLRRVRVCLSRSRAAACRRSGSRITARSRSSASSRARRSTPAITIRRTTSPRATRSARRLRRHPRRHGRQGDGGHGPRGAGKARATDHSRAAGQGSAAE